MKVLFIQKQLFAYSGIMAMSGFLKSNKHECFVLIDAVMSEKQMLEKVKELDPDMIGFTLMSTEHNWFLERAKLLKQYFPHLPIVAGGVHAILYAEELITIPDVDYVCRGEGETTLLQILEYFQSGRTIEEVKGIMYKKNGDIHKTELNRLVELDDFADDRNIYYDDYEVLKNLPLKIFFSSRGCPFKCNFCINGQLMERFKGTGRYVRRKSVENFIAEFEYVKARYGMSSVYIADDLFVWDKKWLQDFSRQYKEKVGVPFITTCYADRLDEEIVQYLSEAGCHTVSFGVESGNEELRTKILNKKISDSQLLHAGELLRKAHIRFQTSNMFCLPSETVEDAIKTIDLNIKMKAAFSMCAIFMPFPKTELADRCIELGILKPDYSFQDIPTSFVTHSVLNIKDKDTIERLQKVAGLIIQYPRLRGFLIFAAKHIKSDLLHFALYLMSQILRMRVERKLTFYQAVSYLWTYRKGI